jgi:3-hydroxybutyryl-CoA dehydrogenase
MKMPDIAVVGTGIMGSGIALACARGGCTVKLWDIQQKAMAQALSNISSALDTLVASNVLTKDDASSSLARISQERQMSQAVKIADIVFEAVPERIQLKKQVFKKLDAMCDEHAILASNTSTFKIRAIASATKNPGRVIGTHWMNPPYLLPLVEVIPSAKTSPAITNMVRNFLISIEKRPVLCGDTPGFLVNRMHSALLVEVISMVEQGVASMEDIDTAWTQHLGPRYCVVGPIGLLDSFGLDTEYSQYAYLQETLKDNKFKPPKLLRAKVRKKELGLKTGKGFYDYSGKNIQSVIRERDEQLTELLRFLQILDNGRKFYRQKKDSDALAQDHVSD